MFLNNVHVVKENVPTVEKKRLLLVLPYLGIILLQTRTKLQQVLKGVLNCCKLEIVFKRNCEKWELTVVDEVKLRGVEYRMIRMMCWVRLIDRVSTDVLRDRVGVVVKIEDMIIQNWPQIARVMEIEITGKKKKD